MKNPVSIRVLNGAIVSCSQWSNSLGQTPHWLGRLDRFQSGIWPTSTRAYPTLDWPRLEPTRHLTDPDSNHISKNHDLIWSQNQSGSIPDCEHYHLHPACIKICCFFQNDSLCYNVSSFLWLYFDRIQREKDLYKYLPAVKCN